MSHAAPGALTLAFICIAVALQVSFRSALAEDAPRPPPVTAVAFAPGGSRVIAGSQAGLDVRRWPSLERERSLETALANVHDMAFSPDGTLLLVAGGKPAEAGRFEVRRWPDGETLLASEPFDDLLYAVAWDPRLREDGDSRRFAAVGHGRDAGIFDARTGKLIVSLEGHSRPVTAVCFTADGSAIVTGSADLSLRVWDAATGERSRTLENHTDAVLGVAARPASASGGPPVVASIGNDRTVRFWQPTIGRLMRFLRLDARPRDLEWTHDGKRVIVVSDDGRLHAIDPVTVEVTLTTSAVDGPALAVAVSPDGAVAAVGGEGGRLAAVDIRDP